MRILCDVNVLVKAHDRSRGPTRQLLLELRAEGHVLIVGPEMLVEVARVLRYPRLQAIFGMDDSEIYGYVQFLRQTCVVVFPDPMVPVVMRDPNDTVVLQTAISGRADIICTWDRDFFSEETKEFCALLGIEICTERELADRVRGSGFIS